MVPAHAGVVPGWSRTKRTETCGPRARGGGPVQSRLTGLAGRWSPRTRGWSRVGPPVDRGPSVVPAHAGVVPARSGGRPGSSRGPRARGGGPGGPLAASSVTKWSPRTRGWSRDRLGHHHGGTVVPAHAGVVPGPVRHRLTRRRGPRARGGGPVSDLDGDAVSVWSPRTRGWSPDRCPAQAPRIVVPAHAGVVPSGPCVRPRPPGGPRARGGGPRTSVSSRPSSRWSPRTRGGPSETVPEVRSVQWSPRTRGWTLGSHRDHIRRVAVPAHAGVAHAPSLA